MDKFRSIKRNSVENKTRVGSKPTARLKSSTFLPSIFRSPINQKWLDATMDNMISKGDLERFDGFVGHYDSSTIEDINDVYVNTGNKKQLSPSIISTNADGTISDVIDFNNILNNISFNFEDTGYNLNYAYRANKFIYNPPIDIDLFVNYQQYYWCFDLPVLELNIDSKVDDLQGKPYGSITYTDAEGVERSIDIFNGMRVKFSDGIDYVIGGVGHSVKFLTHDLSVLNDNGKDYILIERSDNDNTMWSQYNFWVHNNSLLQLSYHIPSMDITQYKNYENQSRRPIIEFYPNIEKVVGHEKQQLNQEPLFMLKDENGHYINEYFETTFRGNKIFSYKHGTSGFDPELGFPLAYKSIGHRSEYVFENSIASEEYIYGTEFSSFENKITGVYYYVMNGEMKSVYTRSAYGHGVKTKSSVITTPENIKDGLSIPIGHSNWRVEKEIIVVGNDKFVSSEKAISEEWNLCFEEQTELTMGSGVSRVFRDLTDNSNLSFWERDENNSLVNVEDPSYVGNITTVRSGNLVEVINPNPIGSIFYYGPDISNLNTIFIIDGTSQDEYFHKVTLDGTPLLKDEYTLNENEILIDGSLIKEGSMVDVEYYDAYSDISKSSEIPDVMSVNADNVILKEFTISETLHHWESILLHTPNIDGDPIGSNNYHKIQKTLTYGGTISISDDNSIMHDACYANPNMNITQALYEQGRDWVSFRKRFMNQLKRFYKTKTFDSPKELVNYTLDSFKNTKSNKEIHKDSNMVFNSTVRDKIYDMPSDGVIYLEDGFNKDYFKTDHVYIHLTHNKNENNSPITELLIKDVDYTIDGSKITITRQPIEFTFSELSVKISVSHHNHYDETFVPASLAKIGLSNMYKPQIVDGELYCHDGYTVSVQNENIDLYNTKSQNFDPILAGLWELENRIYDNTVKRNGESFSNFIDKRQQEQVDSHAEYFFIDYSRKNNNLELNGGRTFDIDDPWTWNYKTVSHVGHWKGCYLYNFATFTPHLTPWHMFGYTNKPTWWDEKYSWTDPVKRQNLIADLSKETKNDLYMWDWEYLCPVDETGNLVYPNLILGSPLAAEAAEDFAFGDWSAVETEWRISAMGQAVMLDAMLKLNPTFMWNKIFNVDTFNHIEPVSSFIDGKVVSPKSSIVHGNGHGKKVKAVNLIRTLDTYDAYSDLKIIFATDDYIKHAEVDVEVVDGKIKNINLIGSGSGYEMVPNLLLLGSDEEGTVKVLGGFEASVVLEDNNQWVYGLSHIQKNYIIRNQFNQDMEVFYKTLHTRLSQNLNGFTAQHLIDVQTETGPVGKFSLGFNDYEVILNQDFPSELLVASAIDIEKTDSGYIISGYSKHKQMFKYLQPIGRNSNDYKIIELSSTTTVRKYNSFSNEVSYVEFGYKFPRVQNVYDFIRGYYEYLKVSGFVFEEDGDSRALAFAQWAIAADIDTTYTVSIGSSLSFDSEFGVVQKFGELPGSYNSILVKDEYGQIVDIEYSDLCITRRGTEILVNPRVSQIDIQGESIVQVVSENIETFKGTETQYQEYQSQDTVSMTGRSGEIVSAAVSVVYLDHYLIIDNKTKFNETIYDDVIGVSHNRLKISGEKTKNWNGTTIAPGYIVNGNTIIQNFDSLVSNSSDFYDLNVAKFNKDVELAETITLGTVIPEWVSQLGLDSNTINKFVQGMIKRKGTRDNIEKIGRSNIVNGGNSSIEVNEEWMFRHSYYGDTTRTRATEILITNDDIKDNSLVLDLDSNDIRFVNNENIPTFKTVDIDTFNNSFEKFYTAGSVKIGESDYIMSDADDFLTQDVTQYDFAKIPSWSGSQEYIRGDVVRKDGLLLKCDVDIIPYVRESEILTITSAVDDSIDIPHGTEFIIDGTTVTFNKFRSNYQDIIVNGTDYGEPGLDGTVNEDNLISSGDFLSINGISLNILRTQSVKVLKDNPYINLTYSPISTNPDVTGMTVQINDVVLDAQQFGSENLNTPSPKSETTSVGSNDVTPSDVPETFTTSAVSPETFNIVTDLGISSISSVTIDGTPTANYTVNGQDIEIEHDGSGGQEVIVTISFDQVLEPITTFDVDETLSVGGWSIDSIDITSGSTTTSISVVDPYAQQITISDPINIGDFVSINLVHAPVASTWTMDEDQFATMISSLPRFTVDKINNKITYVPTTLNDGIRIQTAFAPYGLTVGDTLAKNTFSAYTFTDEIDSTPFNQSELPIIVQQINDAIISYGNLNSVTASGGPLIASLSQDGKGVVITENVNPILNDQIDPNYRIVFTGTVADKLGLRSTAITYDESTPIPTSSSIDDVVSFINLSGISGISSFYTNGVFSITSENSTMTLKQGLVDNGFVDMLGLPLDVFSSPRDLTDNVFNINQWKDISEQDEALSSFWIIDDGKLGNSISHGIRNKFFGWNYQKFQHVGARASIVKGDETEKGNDAVVRLYKTNGEEINHNLEVGDYVMFLNTTTVPETVGVHKVTDIQVSTTGYTFTIDKYIDQDGIADGVFVLRNRRFKTNLEFQQSKTKANVYSYVHGDLVFVDEDLNGTPSSVVYKYVAPINTQFSNESGTFVGDFQIVRQLDNRVLNERIEKVVIYDAKSNQTITELEIFDPLREIIPGVAQKEIDFISAVDLAIYSDSTDETVTPNKDNAWGEAEVGTVWWDTRTVKYIDYEQDDDQYKRQYWGEQVIGSSIDVYEWTKSSVPPQDWEEKVKSKSKEFGFEASGEAFSFYDKETDTYDYYYTEEFEYDKTFDRYNSVYYFWVKNKTTTSDKNRSITVTEIASIINDPDANGIAWCAAISDSGFVAKGITRYLSDDSTVLQIIMKPDNLDHESWTVIAENKDLIPDYWYIGLEDNLVGSQRVSGNPLPSRELNEFNRYGDNRNFKYNSRYYSQAWFIDVWDARKEAIHIINRLLINQNLLMERADTWDRIITKVYHPTSKDTVFGTANHPSEDVNLVPTKGMSYYNEDINSMWYYNGSYIDINDEGQVNTIHRWEPSPGYDMRRTWDWADYTNENYHVTSDPSINVYTKEEFETVDKEQHQIVRFVKIRDNIPRDEIYLLVEDEWVLVKKINGTIQFNDLVWNKFKQIGWDTKSWEGVWDFDVGIFMGLIIKACRDDLFIGQDIVNFNKLFFGMVKYTASLHNQVDWFYKTTYIRLDVETKVDHDVINRPTKYRRSGIDGVVSYTNGVKPYHTKLRTLVDENLVHEDIPITMTEQSINKEIFVDLPRISENENKSMFSYEYIDEFDTWTSNFNQSFDNGDYDEVIDSFQNESEDEYVGPDFNYATNFNSFETYRRYEFNTTIDENLEIIIDNIGGNSVVYTQDNFLNINVFDSNMNLIKSDSDIRNKTAPIDIEEYLISSQDP